MSNRLVVKRITILINVIRNQLCRMSMCFCGIDKLTTSKYFFFLITVSKHLNMFMCDDSIFTRFKKLRYYFVKFIEKKIQITVLIPTQVD